MTILYLYQYFGTPKGGWSTRVYEMTRRWVKEGHKVIVLTTPYDKSDIRASRFVEHQSYEGVEVIVVNVMQSNKHSKVRRLLNFLMFSLVACFYVLRLRYDILIASSGPITIGIPALVAKKIRNIKLCFEVRDLWPRGAVELGILKNPALQKIAFAFERACYLNSELIIACSTGMATDIHERFEANRIIVIPNACDVKLFTVDVPFTPPDIVAKRKIFIYAGSLGLMDDCGQIIEAAAVLSRDSFEHAVIVILGDGAEREMLESRVREEHLDNVIFLGLQPKTEVVKWLSIATASFVVFKNVAVLDTSSPNKFFDSLAAGQPIIQTTRGWIRDLIEHRNIGVNVSPGNAEEMAAAVKLLCTDDALRSIQSRNALEMAKTEFDRDKLSECLLSELQSLMNDKINRSRVL